MREKLFLFVEKEIRKGFTPFKLFLGFLSLFYAFTIFCKNLFYNWIKPKKSPLFVISIGNIVAGGTGKTPFTMLLAERLKKTHRLAIVLRGYRSQCKEERLFTKGTWEEMGDEAFLLQKRLHVPIIVGKNRLACLKLALKAGIEMVLLDDGMQVRNLYKDIEIVLLNAEKPFGGGYLPFGFLRESKKSLKRADFIVVNGKKPLDLSPYWVKPKISRIVGEKEVFPEGKAGAFCAIANPDRFFALLDNIVKRMVKADHSSFNEEELFKFCREAKKEGASYCLCTEKDYIKLPKKSFPLPIYYAELQLEGDIEKIIEKIEKTVNNKSK